MHSPNPPSFRTTRTIVAGMMMHGVVMGEEHAPDAPTFVLVHGLGMSSNYMMPTANLLAESGRVLAPDLPGFGKSEKPRNPLTIPALADALAEWMEAHQPTRPVTLIGNSLGAQVIIDFSVRYPHRLDRAVLVGPTIDPQARKVWIHVFRLILDIVREPVALYWIGLKDYLRAGFSRVLQTFRYALEDPVVEKLRLMQVPVLIVRGGFDPIVTELWVEHAASLVPNGFLVTIPNAAHAVNFSAPESLVAEVVNFGKLCQ
jgi:2-hydroxy-6-oxonona-2,4-dienedioate hydrolase